MNKHQSIPPGDLLYVAWQVGKRFGNNENYCDLLLEQVNKVLTTTIHYKPDKIGAFPSWEALAAFAQTYYEQTISHRRKKKQPVLPSNLDIAPDVTFFHGRPDERAQLCQWIREEQTRLILITGLEGMGKSDLAVQVAHEVNNEFLVYWHDLEQQTPPAVFLEKLLKWLTKQGAISESETIPSGDFGERLLEDLLPVLQKRRILLILDRVETLLRVGEHSGELLPEFSGYAQIIRLFASRPHKSCLLAASRVPLTLYAALGSGRFTQRIRLSAIDPHTAATILSRFELHGSEREWKRFVEHYMGNPLYLRLAASHIQDIYNGYIDRFLRREQGILPELEALLSEQFGRLSSLKQKVVFALALYGDALTLKTLQTTIPYAGVGTAAISQALRQLTDKGLVRRIPDVDKFQLPTLIADYAISRFVSATAEEIETGQIDLFDNHALLDVTASEYLLRFQRQRILDPIWQKLEQRYGSREGAVLRLEELRDLWQTKASKPKGFAGGNMVDLLVRLNYDFTDKDFSGLAIRRADLRRTPLIRTNFAGCDLTGSLFVEGVDEIRSVAASGDGRWLATGTLDGWVQVWQTKTQELRQTWQAHEQRVNSIAFTPNGRHFATASNDGQVYLWELTTGRKMAHFAGHSDWVWSAVVSADGRYLATGGFDGSMIIWSLAEKVGQPAQEITTGDPVFSLAFHHDGETIASGHKSGAVRLWQWRVGRQIADLPQTAPSVWAVAFNPSGSLLATLADDQIARLWDMAQPNLQPHHLSGHTARARSLSFSGDGCLLCSGGEAETIIWKIETTLDQSQFHRRYPRLRWPAILSEKLLAAKNERQSLEFFHLAERQTVRVRYAPIGRLQCAAFSPDGRYLTTGDSNARVIVRDLRSHEQFELNGHKDWVKAVVFTPDGKMMLSLSEDGQLFGWAWTARPGSHPHFILSCPQWSWTVAVHPHGHTIALGGYDKTVYLYVVKNGLPQDNPQHFAVCLDYIWRLAYSPDGRYLVAACEDGQTYVWHTETGQLARQMQSHQKRVKAIAFTGDGRCLATASADLIQIWDTANQFALLREQPAVDGTINAIAFHPTNDTLAVGCLKRKAFLYHAPIWQLAQELPGERRAIQALLFSPQGDLLVAGDSGEQLHLWETEHYGLQAELRSKHLYDGMKIAGTTGINKVYHTVLKALGAVG